VKVKLDEFGRDEAEFTSSIGEKYRLRCWDHFGCGKWAGPGKVIELDIDACLQCAGSIEKIGE